MDEIQKILVKAGRKDLAQKYYKKIALSTNSQSFLQQELYDLEKEFKVKLSIIKDIVYDQNNKKLYTINKSDSINTIIKNVKKKLK